MAIILYILLLFPFIFQLPSCAASLIPSTSQKSFISTLSSPEASVTSLPDDVSKLASSIARQYNKECLRVGLGLDWSGAPHVTLLDDPTGRSILQQYRQSTAGISSMNCMMLLLPKRPSDALLNALSPRGTTKRFFITFSGNRSDAYSYLLDERLREEENVVAIVPGIGNDWDVYIRKLYTSRGTPEVIRVLSMKSDNAELFYEKPIFPEQMKNFYGTKFQATTLEFRPFSDFIRQEGKRTVIGSPCLDIWIFREIAKQLNFTYEIVMPADGQWGTLFENGSWTGVVGAVQHRLTNLSLVLSLTQERTLIADFTRMYFSDPLTFVTAKSRPVPQWQKVFEPFADTVWGATLFSIIASVVLYHLLRRGKLRGHSVSVAQTFMDVYGSFFSQSLLGIPIKLSAQMFLGFWFIYSLLVTTYYKSALMAVLAVPTIPPTINTLQELLSSDLQYGMINAKGSEYQLFSTSEVEIYQKLFKKMSFYSSAESMELVAAGEYAYIYFKANLESIVNTQYTDQSGQSSLHIASEEFFPGGYAWAFPKGVPYARTFDEVMWRCVQAGLITKWVEDLNKIYWLEVQHEKSPEELAADKNKMKNSRNDGLIILSISHLQGVFIALMFGIGAGILSFILELLLYRMCSNDQDDTTNDSKAWN